MAYPPRSTWSRQNKQSMSAVSSGKEINIDSAWRVALLPVTGFLDTAYKQGLYRWNKYAVRFINFEINFLALWE